ncbi:Uncharacterized HTH-type transcriptional regulator yidP [Kluyvera cryocrescens]|uniref:Uncharacterized HTH-type transcriptional regulator yidP n=1 Tax=Kluyvera cryocrescens TaxID=580 RepID=A0A485AZV1_KLUCR|nr:Uncharacterized HTH-type transcriptional regulator yidP [Kluyvera cryocrescens]
MVYQNVINLLKNRLNSAIYNIGDLLPSEKELAELYDVSRNTLRKALKTLEEEGMIERRHGSGTYLRNKHFQASVTHLDSFTEIAKNEGKTPTSQILKFELQTASDEIANSLRVTLGEPVYYAKRLRLIDNIAMQVEETWLSASRFPDLTIGPHEEVEIFLHRKRMRRENHGLLRIYSAYTAVARSGKTATYQRIRPNNSHADPGGG